MFKSTAKKGLLFTVLVYLFSFLFATLYLGKYRAFLFDGSEMLMKIINEKELIFYNNRIFPAISIVLPVFFSKLQATFSVIAWSAIVNYAILPLLTFIYLLVYSNSIKYAVAFSLSLALFETDFFYIPFHDAHISWYLLFVYHSLYDGGNNYFNKLSNVKKGALLCTIVFIILSSHLVSFVPIMLLFTYYIVIRNKAVISICMVLYICFLVLIKLTLFTSGYESGIINYILNFNRYVLDEKLFFSLRKLFITFYGGNINFIFLVVMFYLLRRYIARKVGIFIILNILLVFVFSIVFNNVGYNLYVESYYKIAIFPLCIVMADVLFITSKIDYKIKILFAFVFVFSLYGIYSEQEYRQYYHSVNNMTKYFDLGSRNILYTKDTEIKGYDFDQLTCESAVISKFEQNREVSCMITSDTNLVIYLSRIQYDSFYLNSRNTVSLNKIDTLYFNFRESSDYYIIDTMDFDITKIRNSWLPLGERGVL